MNTAEDIIEALGLEPLHPEGGYYKETYRAGELVPRHALPPRYSGDRLFGSAIYYLLSPDTCSALHRLLTDEVYHFYLGDPVHMLLLYPGGASETVTLGHDIAGGQHVQAVVPRGVWQGSRLLPGGRFALMGTTMAPGFEADDYEDGDRAALIAAYPDRAELITQLTS
jgi:predicted cupin superfamily sugar epimerase